LSKIVSSDNEGDIFEFKQFTVNQSSSAMKVGTDSILLGSWVDHSNPSLILDIGTGTGVIALICAQRWEDSDIYAVEIEAKLAQLAAENFAHSPWHDRLNIDHSSIQKFSEESAQKFDLIVCNPPFFTGGTLSMHLDKNAVRHTIKLSHADLLLCVKKLLNANGIFAVVLPYIEGLRFIEIAALHGLHCKEMKMIRSKSGKPIERILLSFSLISIPFNKSEMILMESDGVTKTPEYATLVNAFYL